MTIVREAYKIGITNMTFYDTSLYGLKQFQVVVLLRTCVSWRYFHLGTSTGSVSFVTTG